ncbi:MAG: ATP synthase subunit I [Deltaproteobacteria bacterium]|nr:ATP synthase subunit I [Deltaproteobacteria bacterium]
MLRKSRTVIEKLLRDRGFTSPESRRIIASQILLAGASLLLGLLTFRATLWPLAFGIGACLAAVNLWWTARGAHWSVGHQFSAGLAVVYFGAFLLRFAGIGLAVYCLLVWARFPFIPLLAGLFSHLVCLLITGFSRNAGNSCKEA